LEQQKFKLDLNFTYKDDLNLESDRQIVSEAKDMINQNSNHYETN